MAWAGETIGNPITGERVTWLATSADTGGKLLRFEWSVAPGGAVAAAHAHPFQQERFDFTAGSARMRLGGRVVKLRAPKVVEVRPGLVHRVWNDDDDDLRATIEFRPALRTEEFFEQLWGGRLNRWGMPTLGLAVALARADYLDEVRLPLLPLAAQRAIQRILVTLGDALGA
jgi:quercetin dioxygenase-like cupin family protein